MSKNDVELCRTWSKKRAKAIYDEKTDGEKEYICFRSLLSELADARRNGDEAWFWQELKNNEFRRYDKGDTRDGLRNVKSLRPGKTCFHLRSSSEQIFSVYTVGYDIGRSWVVDYVGDFDRRECKIEMIGGLQSIDIETNRDKKRLVMK